MRNSLMKMKKALSLLLVMTMTLGLFMVMPLVAATSTVDDGIPVVHRYYLNEDLQGEVFTQYSITDDDETIINDELLVPVYEGATYSMQGIQIIKSYLEVSYIVEFYYLDGESYHINEEETLTLAGYAGQPFTEDYFTELYAKEDYELAAVIGPEALSGDMDTNVFSLYFDLINQEPELVDYFIEVQFIIGEEDDGAWILEYRDDYSLWYIGEVGYELTEEDFMAIVVDEGEDCVFITTNPEICILSSNPEENFFEAYFEIMAGVPGGMDDDDDMNDWGVMSMTVTADDDGDIDDLGFVLPEPLVVDVQIGDAYCFDEGFEYLIVINYSRTNSGGSEIEDEDIPEIVTVVAENEPAPVPATPLPQPQPEQAPQTVIEPTQPPLAARDTFEIVDEGVALGALPQTGLGGLTPLAMLSLISLVSMTGYELTKKARKR